MSKRLRILVPCLIAAVHVTSFFLPAYDRIPGWGCYWLVGFLISLPGSPDLMGWLIILGWLANPFCWIGIALLATGRPRLAAVAGLAGTLGVVGASVFMFLNASWQLQVRALGPGFYLWLAGFFLLGVAGFGEAVWVAGTAPEVD